MPVGILGQIRFPLIEEQHSEEEDIFTRTGSLEGVLFLDEGEG